MVDDSTCKNPFCLVTFCVISFMHSSLCFLLLQWDSSPSTLLDLPCHFLCKTSAITSTGYVTRDVVKMRYDHSTKVPERRIQITHAQQILWNNDSLDVIIVFKTEVGLARLSGELFSFGKCPFQCRIPIIQTWYATDWIVGLFEHAEADVGVFC